MVHITLQHSPTSFTRVLNNSRVIGMVYIIHSLNNLPSVSKKTYILVYQDSCVIVQFYNFICVELCRAVQAVASLASIVSSTSLVVLLVICH
jgi:hypothetical protein